MGFLRARILKLRGIHTLISTTPTTTLTRQATTIILISAIQITLSTITVVNLVAKTSKLFEKHHYGGDFLFGGTMEVKINKEIKEYNETMFFGLSVRQFIFAVLACGAAVGIYFGCRSFMGTETLSWVCMLGAAPFAALGFIKYNGMTAEKIAKAWIRSEILMPKKILFNGTNKLIGQEDKRK